MLRNLLSRLKASRLRPPALPDALREALAQRQTAPLVSWARQALAARADAPELALLLDAARHAGWHAHDVDKLAVAAAHGAGRWALALAHAAAHVHDDEGFDADIAVMAADALYHLCRFEDAWLLLEQLAGREDELAARADFSLLAALIAQANDRMAAMKLWIDRARRLAPDDTATAFNALLMNFEAGDDAAVAALEEAIDAGRYASAMTDLARATLELARGHYTTGFYLLEARYRIDDAHRYINGALFDRPRWQGEPLAGRRLLISAEQGLGDLVMMARYLPLLAAQGAGALAIEAQAEACGLLRANFPFLTVVERRLNAVPAGLTFDLWVGMMSLPHLLGTTAETVPARAGYLRAPEENTAYWRQRVAELAPRRRPRIGIAWSGQRMNRADRRRSLPVHELFPLLAACPADFFALQKEVPPQRPTNLIDVADELMTLADTAALIEQMDLVLTICSCPAHLAGSMGKETWLMLPYRWEWRWGHEGETNRWYDSVKVCRQSQHGDWNGVLQQIFGVRLPAWTCQQGS